MESRPEECEEHRGSREGHPCQPSKALAHELGHILLGHTKPRKATLKQRVQEEKDADAFALKAVSRIRPDAEAMVMYFSLTSIWTRVLRISRQSRPMKLTWPWMRIIR